MRKSCVGALGALVGIALTTTSALAADGKCGKVTLAKMNWASAAVITEITNFLMVQGYGCDVKMVPSATTTAITSLAENNEPDVVPEEARYHPVTNPGGARSTIYDHTVNVYGRDPTREDRVEREMEELRSLARVRPLDTLELDDDDWC